MVTAAGPGVGVEAGFELGVEVGLEVWLEVGVEVLPESSSSSCFSILTSALVLQESLALASLATVPDNLILTVYRPLRLSCKNANNNRGHLQNR